jgi:hypothetical protein
MRGQRRQVPVHPTSHASRPRETRDMADTREEHHYQAEYCNDTENRGLWAFGARRGCVLLSFDVGGKLLVKSLAVESISKRIGETSPSITDSGPGAVELRK